MNRSVLHNGNMVATCHGVVKLTSCNSRDLRAFAAHTERIRRHLSAFLVPADAAGTAIQICHLALEVDEEIGQILKDPLVGRYYNYDGQFFSSRNGNLLHRAIDGYNLLDSLDHSTIDSYFRGRDSRHAMTWLLDEQGKHLWIAKVRRRNWENFGSLGMLPPEILKSSLEVARGREGDETLPSPLSSEELAFFRSFEHQLSVGFCSR